MEVASERLCALLAAAVARSSVDAGVTASGKHADAATQAAATGERAGELAVTPAAFTAEDRAAWDAILADASSSDDQQQSLADTIGLLLASTTVSDAKLVRLLHVLLTDASFDSSGVLLVVQMTVRGLKVAKRYNALELAARALPDAVFAKIHAPATAARALSFWLELLLGYQHTGELFLANHAKLAAVATSISEQLRDASGISADELSAMKTHLILACTALMYCHRAYEHECYVLRLALMQAFSADDVAAPTAASAETLLRESAWVLPIDRVSKFLPSIEGKWVVDEFANDAAGASSGAQNAGSVLLRTTRSCVAHELRASVVSRTGAQTLRLNGLLFQELPEMQELAALPDTVLTAPWELEGHWSQVFESSSAAPARASAPVVSAASTPWTCHACTMSNDASAAKCTTCGTASPGQVTIQTAFDDVHGSNPAPFTATFDATYAFMRVQWSRGEQHGVWLAAKQAQTRAFDLQTAIARASDSMTDATHLAMHAYSPSGVAAYVLVLEKPIVSSGSSAELTLELWLRPRASDVVQVVLAYGSDFVLSLLPTGELVWDVADKSVSLQSAQPLRFDAFAHVTLTLSRATLTMAIDSVVSSECARSAKLSRLFTTRTSVFSLGGRVESDSASTESVFVGAICDLRIWSTAQPPVRATASLEGDEECLVGYYPLVSAGPRLLLDVSKTENHATVFEAFAQTHSRASARSAAPVVVQSFAPTAALEHLPVQRHFPSALGDAFIGSGRFSLVDGANALVIDRSSAGAALWHAQPVSLASGFDTSFQFETTASSASAVVFALCDASYWSVAPLIEEASSVSSPDSLAGRGSSHTALFVHVEAVPTGSSTSGALQYAIALFVRSKKHNYKLGAARAVVASGDAPAVRITYALPDKVLAVELGATGAVFECAIDLALALGIESASSMRAGLVFPSTEVAPRPAPSLLRLNAWQYEERSASPADATAASVLASVYTGVAVLQPARASGDAATDAPVNTVVCTRCSSDGSAIEQECYGCQTCNLLHGSTLCRICASVCHEGHELVAMGVMSAACACHTRGSGLCRCTAAVNADDFPQLQHAIATPLWCCSKCTVINASTLSECSICGNKAPRCAATAPTGAGVSPAPLTVSTSRALALVETPLIEALAADWSCEACTMLNTADATKCTMCDTARAKPAPAPVASEAKSSSSNNSGMLALYNAAASSSSNVVVAKPAAPTTWTCSACTMENKSTDSVCYMCSTPNAVPIAAAVDTSSTPEVIMALPAPSADATLLPVPIDLTRSDSSTAASGQQQRPSSPPSVAIPTDVATAAVENLKFLRAYKQTVADATSQRDVVDALQDSHWETTTGLMTISLHDRTVAEYVDGTYADHDGYVRGLARITPDGVWKLDGTYKKLTQTHANAVVLQWDPSATRFDGKWFRGDGAGDWKCVLAPSASLFRGWNTVEDAKDVAHRQPFYSGLVNMKQNLTNVCYQNSFLQTLFMTQAFRRLILSTDLSRYAATNGDASHDVLSCIQRLFAHMLASQRPALATHGLQRCLPATFQAGRQQDTSDFAHYLIDSLSEQLSQQPDTVTGVSDIFGGIQATVLACKTCGHTSVNKEYFWELLLNMIDLRYTPITGITAVSGSSMDIATPSGYERLNTDVNKDRNGAPYVFLCVKRSPERSSAAAADAAMDVDDPSLMPITDLVVKVAPFHDVRPTLAGYDRVELDLNVGGSTSVVGGKKQVYLFTRREPNGSPITDLQVIYGNESVPDGFKQIRVDLNQGDGTKVFLCYRCDMPITDVKIVNSGIPGYKMVDHLLNASHDDPVKQYLAYQVGGNEPCLTDLALVPGADVAQHQAAGWTSIGSPTSVVSDATALTDGATPLPPAQLMIRRGHGNPIFAVDVFRAPRHVPKYNDYEVIDVYPRDGTSDVTSRLRGDWMATDDVDRSRKAVRIHAVSEPLPEALVFKGAFDDKGEIAAIATVTSTWSQSVAASSGAPSASAYRVTGHWKSSKVKQPQLFDVELRPDATSSMYALSGTIGDGKGRPVTLQGTQTSRVIKVKWPISELFVLRGDERVPDGVKVVRETVSGRSGNLLAQTASPHSLYLAVKREEAPASGAFVADVCVIYGEIDVVPDGFTCIETTPGGFSANLNDGTPGVPIFVCYRKTERSSSDASAKVLMDVLPMWTSGPQVDAVPPEFTKIAHTPLGMDANVNQGTVGVSIHLCVATSDVAHIVKPVESLLNGEFEITSSAPSGFGRFLSLSVMQRLESARVVDGKFGTILHGHLPGSFRATMVETTTAQQHRLVGVWSLESPAHPTTMSDFVVAHYPFELTLSDANDELDGWWSGTDESATTAPGPNSGASSASSSHPSAGSGAWKLLKDSYVRVGFKKDYGTEWRDGRLIASERVWRHDIASMLSRFVATRTLGGDNALSCAQCDRKTESRTHTVVVSPPAHLILTVKRMFYDWTQQKTRKSLHDVTFPALLTLPSLSDADAAVIADDGNTSQQQSSRQYGLYGVLIHSGMTANSGHYYSFCRESDDAAQQQLHMEDAPASPWIKFNDTKVERSSWREINRLVANSVSDAVYLLLYKRLTYDVPSVNDTDDGDDDAAERLSASADDDEAMLLAKAMALSMSAAGRKRDSVDETSGDECKRDEDACPTTDDAAQSAPPHPRIQASILKEVRLSVDALRERVGTHMCVCVAGRA